MIRRPCNYAPGVPGTAIGRATRSNNNRNDSAPNRIRAFGIAPVVGTVQSFRHDPDDRTPCVSFGITSS